MHVEPCWEDNRGQDQIEKKIFLKFKSVCNWVTDNRIYDEGHCDSQHDGEAGLVAKPWLVFFDEWLCHEEAHHKETCTKKEVNGGVVFVPRALVVRARGVELRSIWVHSFELFLK